MNEQEFNALVEKLEEKTGAKITETVKAELKSIEGLKSLDIEAVKGIVAAKEEDAKKYDNLMEVIKNQGLEISKLKENSTPSNKKGELEEFLTAKEREEFLNKKSAGWRTLKVKAAALMTTANVVPNVAGGFNQLFGNYIDDTIHETPKPDNFILPLVTVESAPGTENIWYVERKNEEGDAQFIGEGDAKPLIDAEWIESKADIKEVASFWKMSKRLVNHAPSVVGNFRTHANELMEQKIDDGVSSGDGVGNNLNGISTAASPFVVPAQLANYYENANIFDAVMAVATYVRLNNFKGELTCVLNTVWKAKMLGVKAEDNSAMYIKPDFVSPDGTNIGGINIIFNNKVDDTKILLGDLKKFQVRISENIEYGEGYVNDDFQKNLMSYRLEAFLGTYLPSNYDGSIIYDDIATVLTAIEAPAV